MQKNKIVLAVTAVVVLALLFAGVGYATFSGNARTYNQDNTQTLAYMSVTPADFTAILNDGETIFDTYVYNDSGAQTAYKFHAASTTVTVGQTVYTAMQIGTKVLTVKNQTGDAITAVTVNIASDKNVGSTDFVYIFKLEATGAAQYVVFNGGDSGQAASLAAAIADGASTPITVTIYIAYLPNVYAPTNHIGPVAAVADGTHTVAYIHPAAAPLDLLTDVDFGFDVVDATPAPSP